MTENELLNRLNLGENQDTEFKSGIGGLPKSLWESVSAFANTNGGYLVIGVQEKKGLFEVTGLSNPDAQRKAFWDGHNDLRKLSTPLCHEEDVNLLSINQGTVLSIFIPPATRTQRPVYINGNPLLGTYKRRYEGDYRCIEQEVKQMLRDADDKPQDSQVLPNFDMDDIDLETFKTYRNRFISREPDHPFLALDHQGLLEKLGAWRRDRANKQAGLTVAGLLMFGKEQSLLEAFPFFHLDYQEQLSSDPEVRWNFRLTQDGHWEGNLFNFYSRVYRRLTDELEIPFKLNAEGVRQGETHVHEALREALINCLVHADHQSSRPIKIIKRRAHFELTNPGRLRISVDQLYSGGISDPRNPTMLKMFQMLGLGEKSGSGMPKILRAWKEQAWLMPLVSENLDLDMTTIMLPLISIIPEVVERELKAVVGNYYTGLTELDRLILVMAHQFNSVTNSDIKRFHPQTHPRDIGERLKYLVAQEWLQQFGHGRGTRYHFTGKTAADQPTDNSVHLESDSVHLKNSSVHLTVSEAQRQERLLLIASKISSTKKAKRELMNETILQLCADDYLELRALAKLLNRSSETLRTHYVIPLVERGQLKLRFPDQLNHPQQAYKIVSDEGINMPNRQER